MTEAVIIKSMDWFLYDNGPRHERVKIVHVTLHYFKKYYEGAFYEDILR